MVISSFGHNDIRTSRLVCRGFRKFLWSVPGLFGSTSTGGTDREIILLLNGRLGGQAQGGKCRALKRSGDEVKKIRKRSQDTANTLRNAKE